MAPANERNPMYMMPAVFGPSISPRRGVGGTKFECLDNPKKIQSRLTYSTNRQAVESILPDGYELTGDPRITFSFAYISDIEWLAGRGYNILFVYIPGITFRGKEETVTGSFLPVLWENLTEPILTGREELGYSKIFCDLPEMRWLRGSVISTASWDGHCFAEMELSDLSELSATEVETVSQQPPTDDGVLHYRYVPRIGEWGSSEVEQTVITPSGNTHAKIVRMWRAEGGKMAIHTATWEQMPTQYMIVNRLAEFELREIVGATITETVGGKDLSDQRIIQSHKDQR